MPAVLSVTEDEVQRLAPDSDSIQAVRGLVRKKSFLAPGIAPDGTWLLAQCKGSGSKPYEVSIDLADPSNPTFRCTCPSRKFPCKHGLGLLLLYAEAPDQFQEQGAVGRPAGQAREESSARPEKAG